VKNWLIHSSSDLIKTLQNGASINCWELLEAGVKYSIKVSKYVKDMKTSTKPGPLENSRRSKSPNFSSRRFLKHQANIRRKMESRGGPGTPGRPTWSPLVGRPTPPWSRFEFPFLPRLLQGINSQSRPLADASNSLSRRQDVEKRDNN